ncbi:MAG: hypothetical protein KGI54_16515, partial [Pseudomonadota bacterium]|nr:hypothetical protein [Pseudomonadota bacterium]
QFSYKNSEVKFYDLVQQFWQPYGGNVQIPGCDFYMLSDGTWYDKFHQIFPFPYYEFFVTTAPSTFYASGSAVTPASQSVGITGFTQGVPQIVARKNPLPRLSPQADGTLQIDTSLWDSLTPFFMNLEELSGIEQSISFDSAEVRNFYLLNPTNMLALFGVSNGNNSPWVFSYAGLADAASIHRYGYLPQISELHWWADPTGSQAQNAYENGISPTDWNNLVEILNYQQASYFEPTPLMAKGSITFRLRPDIFIGSKFLFSPWKQQDTWEFYVEGVSHNYVFGGQSTTTLQLSRGLPSSVYQNSNLLTAIHQGNAQRINGTYTKGIPSSLGNYLQPVNFQTAKSVLSDVAQLFNAPQYRNQ